MSVNCKLYFVREYDFPDESIEGESREEGVRDNGLFYR